MSIDNALASLAVKDLAVSLEWYERILGRPADSQPMPGLAEWKFARGGGLQVYQLPERAGSGSCTLSATQLEELIARLDQQGVNTEERTANALVKTVMIVDPDGNHIAFAEPLDPTLAR
ncbi:MAG TPA: VOC family protein [Pirellulales bacterium]